MGSRARRRGFTLIEIILVVAISLIISGLAVPAFMRSYQAASLRAASRTVVTAGKYARNMAVLQQRQMAVFFDSQKGTIRVVSLERAGGSNLDAFLDGRRGGMALDDTFQTAEQRTFELPEQVRIADFSAPSRLQEVDGLFWVNYFPSGVSDSFSLRMVDGQQRRSVRIEVDHLAGTTTTTYE